MTVLASDIASAAKGLASKHLTSAAVLPFVPAINSAIDAAVQAGDVIVERDGLAALAKHFPTLGNIVAAAMPLLDGALKGLTQSPPLA